MNALYALVLVFSPTVNHWTEEPYATNISFEACDAAQHAVWAQDWETVGYDAEGNAIPEQDAYCVPMDQLVSVNLTNF